MSTRILSIALLLLSVCLCAYSAPGNRRHPGRNRAMLCCTVVSSVNISDDVTSNKYEHQRAKDKCVEAIILHVSEGKICVDPEAEWVKKLIVDMTPVKS